MRAGGWHARESRLSEHYSNPLCLLLRMYDDYSSPFAFSAKS